MTIGLAVWGSLSIAEEPQDKSSDAYVGEKVVVYATATETPNFPDTDVATPSFDISKENIEKVNYSTVEDVFRRVLRK
ncbi:MAG: hypothetical protein ACRESZ_00075 [Methylococcales bacterium]